MGCPRWGLLEDSSFSRQFCNVGIIESYAEEDVTTYQERISSDLTNMLERSRITLQLT